METLQTIWTALSTPNPQLTNILISPLVFIEATVTMLLFTSILNIQTTKKQKLIYIILIALSTNLANILIGSIDGFIVIFINILLWTLIAKFILNISWLKTLIAIIIQFLSVTVIESIFLNLYLSLFNISTEEANTTFIYRFTFALFIYFSIFILYKLCKHFNFNITLLENMDKKTKIILILNFILGIITIFIHSYLNSYYSDIIPLAITCLSTLTLISYFVISIFSLMKTTQLQIATQDLEESQLYNKSLKILHDNVRAFKHDFSNIVQAIGGYISTDDLDGLKTYYSQLLSDCQQVNNLSTLSPDVINNPAIYSILASKYHKADSLGIKIKLEIFINLNELNVKIYEFTRILGILLDNAIEATKECDKKLIIVEFRKETSRNRQLLIIKNTYLEKDIDLDKIFEKGYSSKPNNTGLGLWEVREILKKNNNLNLYTSKTEELFSQQLEIYL